MRQFISGRKERRKRQREERKKQKQQSQEETMLGKIIDLPLEDFKAELVLQRVNIGTMNNLILNLEGAYNELRMRKDGVLNLIFTGAKSKEDPEVKKVLDGLYAEMTKVEQKITYLKERVKELVNVG